MGDTVCPIGDTELTGDATMPPAAALPVPPRSSPLPSLLVVDMARMRGEERRSVARAGLLGCRPVSWSDESESESEPEAEAVSEEEDELSLSLLSSELLSLPLPWC